MFCLSSFPQDCWLHTETMDQVCLVGKDFLRIPEIVQLSGQISSRPHTTDFPPNSGLVREIMGNRLISGKSMLVKYCSIWPELCIPKSFKSLPSLKRSKFLHLKMDGKGRLSRFLLAFGLFSGQGGYPIRLVMAFSPARFCSRISYE